MSAQHAACGRGGTFGSGHRAGVGTAGSGNAPETRDGYGLGSGGSPVHAGILGGSGNRAWGVFIGVGFRFLGL